MPAVSPSGPDLLGLLPGALCAAELGEPLDPALTSTSLAGRLSPLLANLADRVPHAAMCLLERLADHRRAEVRAEVGRALASYIHHYPERTEPLLRRLSVDRALSVRLACARALVQLVRGRRTEAACVVEARPAPSSPASRSSGPAGPGGRRTLPTPHDRGDRGEA
jgi:hypothetical protein